ncbi:MAG: hypothetical protein ACMXYA_00165 [Candidatus Woesearchaeota archaeon]
MGIKSELHAYNNVLKQKSNILVFFIASLFFGSLISYLTNLQLIEGNFGTLYKNITLLLMILLSLLFGLNMAALFARIKLKMSHNPDASILSIIGTFFAILVAGCGVCGFSIAGVLGLASFVSLLPYYGLELKILAVFLLLLSNHLLFKPLACTKKKPKGL